MKINKKVFIPAVTILGIVLVLVATNLSVVQQMVGEGIG